MKTKRHAHTKLKRPTPVRVQPVVSQATSAALEYELLNRAIERGYELIRLATENLATLQDKQRRRLLERASQKRRLANIRS